jgi:carboxyl-terminal processing protease
VEEPTYQTHPQPGSKPAGRLRKNFAMLIVVALIFGAGLAIGRGDIHLQGLTKNTTNTPANALDYSSVNQVYDILKKDFDGKLDKNQLTDGLKTGLVNATGDPYTEYFNPKDAKEFNDQLKGSITGIGAELGTSGGNIVIVAPLAGFPAEKAGLKPKDIVAAINGKTTTGMTVSTAVRSIRGDAGTKVTLTIVRSNGNPFDVTIAREKITVPSVKWQVDGSIGYMKVSQFTDDTIKLAQQAAQDFKAKNVKAIVLDLRADPGGYLTAAINLSSLWLDNGKTVVQERRGGTIVSTETASGNNPLKGIPTIVLIDGGSASASEITAGALRDNGAATLLGEKSFGKGSVQQVENLPGGSEMKVTVARWYTPDGQNIDKQGIKPDTVVTISDADAKAGKDAQKDKAYQLLQAKL